MIATALLLLDPAGTAPVLGVCNARPEPGKSYASYITPETSVRADVDGAVSIRALEESATGACCA